MNEINLDATLRDALMEALREDWEAVLDQPEHLRQSHRQKRRFRRMLADPRGYYRRWVAAPSGAEETPVSLTDIRRYKNRLRRLAIAAVLAALLASSAVAYSLGGGEYLTRMFRSISVLSGVDQSAMNTDQLPELSGGNIGAVVDSPEFRFELLDIVSDGYSAIISVRVTEKQTRQLLRQGEMPQFDWADSSLMDSHDRGFGYGTSATEEYGPLAANQYFILFTVTSDSLIPAGEYTVDLYDYGYRTPEGEHTVLYPGVWTIPIVLPDGGAHSRSMELQTPYTFGGLPYVVEDARVSPLAIILNLTSQSGQLAGDTLYDLLEDQLSIVLEDGTVLGREWAVVGMTGSGTEDGEYNIRLTLELNGPLTAEEIAGVKIGESLVDLRA